MKEGIIYKVNCKTIKANNLLAPFFSDLVKNKKQVSTKPSTAAKIIISESRLTEPSSNGIIAWF